LEQLGLYSQLLNPLNTELNPICHLLALLRAHLIFHVSRIRVNALDLEINNTGDETAIGLFPPKTTIYHMTKMLHKHYI
jgi:hypothetical protein